MSRQAYMVLGMHRSGTSAMTRVISLTGAALPPNLIPAIEGENDRGFWESEDVLSLDHAMLIFLGSDWDDAHLGSFTDLPDRLRPHFAARCDEVIARCFAASDTVVMKDPRLSALFPFWRERLALQGVEALPVVMVRHPLEIAGSLRVRNGFALARSTLLWLAYIIAAERDTRGLPRIFVAYADLLKDVREVLDRIEAVFARPLPDRGEAAMAQVDAYLTPSLRHHEADRPLDDPEVWEAVRIAYAWFAQAAAGTEPDPSALDRIGEQLIALCEATDYPPADLRTPGRSLVPELIITRQVNADLLRRLEDAKRMAAHFAEHSQALEQAMADMRASASWRLTAPLRGARGRLR